MSKFLSFLGYASILIITQSHAMDNVQSKEIELSQISKDNLKTIADLSSVKKKLHLFLLANTKKLASYEFYNDLFGINNTIYTDLKNLLTTRNVLAFTYVDKILDSYERLSDQNTSFSFDDLVGINKQIVSDRDALVKAIKSLNNISSLIDESAPDNFAAFHEKIQKEQQQIIDYLNGINLADVARTWEEKKFSSDISKTLGIVLYPRKSYTTDDIRKSILRGENIEEAIEPNQSCMIELEEMRAPILKMMAQMSEMLMALHYTAKYEQNILEFTYQQKHLDSYFLNSKKFLNSAHEFIKIMNMVRHVKVAGQNPQLENFLVVIDTNDGVDMAYAQPIQSWLKRWNFAFDTKGIYLVTFESINTKDAKMEVVSETMRNGRVYHNELFTYSIGSSENICRAAREEELCFFNAITLLMSPKGTLAIVDPTDDKMIWTIDEEKRFIAARFAQVGKLITKDKGRHRLPILVKTTND